MAKGPTEDVTRHLMDSGEAVAILLPFRNTDVGTWESVREFSEDDQGNHFDANVLALDTRGTLVKSQSDKLVAVANLRDLVVVDSEEILLILPRDDVDKIKDIQALLADSDKSDYL